MANIIANPKGGQKTPKVFFVRLLRVYILKVNTKIFPYTAQYTGETPWPPFERAPKEISSADA